MDELDRWATGRLLSAAARLVEHEWNSHLAQWDLNHAGLAVLHVLLGGPMTQRELAAAVQVEDQTMSRTVERLERSQYVERRRDDADRRRVVVTLTASGRATCLRASDVEVAEGYVDHGSPEDLAALRRTLATIIRNLSSQRWPAAVCAAERPARDAAATPDAALSPAPSPAPAPSDHVPADGTHGDPEPSSGGTRRNVG